jgi:DNA-binding winged helix-turn-helix (wHTH) protein
LIVKACKTIAKTFCYRLIRLFLGMNWKVVSFLLGVCLLLMLAAFVTEKKGKSDFEAAREIIVMRKIAHRLLLHIGDSTSRVQPVKQVSPYEFMIPFETGFSFKPDSLVRIIGEVITAHQLPQGYIVNVSECSTGEVIFGYAIMGTQQTDIVPCGGRDQPVLRYCINIKFQEQPKSSNKLAYIAGISFIIIGLGASAMLLYKKKNKITEPVVTEMASANTTATGIGRFLFFPEQLLLVLDEEKIILTNKESKLLGIFAQQPNQIIDRSKLQKEVWEDEGVIVGRSLDVFVSRLRKKLEKDTAVQLVTVHGKGYKLEISNNKEI